MSGSDRKIAEEFTRNLTKRNFRSLLSQNGNLPAYSNKMVPTPLWYSSARILESITSRCVDW